MQVNTEIGVIRLVQAVLTCVSDLGMSCCGYGISWVRVVLSLLSQPVQVWLLLLISGIGNCNIPPEIKQLPCPCSDHMDCRRPVFSDSNQEKEVLVFTNGKSDFESWNWQSITTVVATDDKRMRDIMCEAHRQKKKFGFQVPPLLRLDSFNSTTSNETQTWMRGIAQKRLDLRADVVVVDLVDIFHADSVDLDALIKLLHHVKDSISPVSATEKMPVKLICVVPWKPPCVNYQNKNNCSFTQQAIKVCSWFLLSPQSYTYLKDYGCKARATVPETKMSLGVDDYAVQGVYEGLIILGIPWHGYEYICKNQNVIESKICMLNQVSVSVNSSETKCDVNNRTKMSLGDMITKHYGMFKNHETDRAYQAPFYTYYDNATKVYKQVWFENSRSLRLKYQYAHDFGLKGIGIYTAEDLSEIKSGSVNGFNGGMWNWVLHQIIQEGVKTPPVSKYHSDSVAGIAIGCMLVGVILGIVFMIILFRVRVKKKIQRPFRKDGPDEYHDEDDLNL